MGMWLSLVSGTGVCLQPKDTGKCYFSQLASGDIMHLGLVEEISVLFCRMMSQKLTSWEGESGIPHQDGHIMICVDINETSPWVIPGPGKICFLRCSLLFLLEPLIFMCSQVEEDGEQIFSSFLVTGLNHQEKAMQLSLLFLIETNKKIPFLIRQINWYRRNQPH